MLKKLIYFLRARYYKYYVCKNTGHIKHVYSGWQWRCIKCKTIGDTEWAKSVRKMANKYV